MNNNERQLFTIRWTQPYPTNELVGHLHNLRDVLIEQVLEHEEFTEAKAALDRIMKL